MPPTPLPRMADLAGRWFSLWRTLVVQEMAVRYRGTLLGRAWPLLSPLLFLSLYGFMFGAVFRARWPGLADTDHVGFALNLFTGLLVHGLLAEVLGQATTLFPRNSNFVRKMVFPLPVLAAVPVGTAVVQAAGGFLLVVIANGVVGGGWQPMALLLPLLLFPYLLLLYGLALLLSALGVYLRDLSQLTSTLVSALLFTSPVFFPRSMVPAPLALLVDYNPITWPIETARACLLQGQLPPLGASLVYAGVALAMLFLGGRLFGLLRRGFADLL